MAATFLQLVNKLRARFNETDLTSANWSSAVGFDQYTKDAINYAYHDILNAEMEWPFLHNECTFQVEPGVRTYTPTITAGTNQNTSIKEIDWDSFYLNTTDDNVTHAVGTTVPATAPYEIDLTAYHDDDWYRNTSVVFTIGTVTATPTDNDPAANEYCIFTRAKYRFNSADASKAVVIIYKGTSPAESANIVKRTQLPYMDYDNWRQRYQQNDYNLPSAASRPAYIYKTQNQGEVGISPIPDSYYDIIFECWIDADDLSTRTDTTLLPSRFDQVLLDGAAYYCYGFREDQPMAKEFSNKFTAGIQRMRVELINRNSTMQAGFGWRHSNLRNAYGNF